MQRGKPLYLNDERYAALTYLVRIFCYILSLHHILPNAVNVEICCHLTVAYGNL